MINQEERQKRIERRRRIERKRRRKKKRFICCVIVVILICILTAVGIYAGWKLFADKSDNKNENQKVKESKDIVLETSKDEQTKKKEDIEQEQQKKETFTDIGDGTEGLPICMYHYVYDPSNPPDNLDNNFISTEALEEEMKYLHENGYYFPTWEEVRAYVDGELLLPKKSIVITFDDGPNYMDLGIPILEKYEVPATSFVIASYWDSKDMLYGYASDFLRFESHSYKMHQGGGNIGHGGIYTAMSKEEILADLQKSFEICGNKDAFAYPFGDYTEEGCATLEEAGLLCAVTTENAKCFPGDNPYTLPRIRMLGTQTLSQFIAAIE